jgi:hypothetical protein
MEELIKIMFLHVEVIGPQVQAGHYDITDSKGNVVLPTLWKYSVKSTEEYSMSMWPMDDRSKREAPGLLTSKMFPPPPPPPPQGRPLRSGPPPPPPPAVTRKFFDINKLGSASPASRPQEGQKRGRA